VVAIITGAFLYDTLFTRPAWGGKAITIQLVRGCSRLACRRRRLSEHEDG